jgi:hypothetical protein
MEMKHNKTWYNNRIREANEKLEALRAEIAKAVVNCSSEADNDALNVMYDQEYEILEGIRSLEYQRDTRNWTASEWITSGLIAQNID